MRIAMIDNSRGWGGAEELLLTLCRRLRDHGHEIDIFLREGSETVRRFGDAGFTVLAVPRQGAGMLRGFMGMIRTARRRKFDLVHVHRNHDLLTGKVLSCSAGNPPLILTQHCQLGKASSFSIGLPDCIVTVSHFIADGIIQRFPARAGKLRVVYNGIDLDDFAHPRTDYWADKPELKGKGPLMGVVGYFYKNQEELIELLPRVKKAFPEVVLIIIGRDDSKRVLLERKAVEMGVTGSVYFAGSIPHGEMKHALAGLDLNVSTFRREGFGLSVIEGMAVGTPFVGYRNGGYTEIVEHGKTGCLVETRDEMVDVLIKLLADKESLRNIQENAKSSVRQRYSLDTMLMQYESIYNELLNDTMPY